MTLRRRISTGAACAARPLVAAAVAVALIGGGCSRQQGFDVTPAGRAEADLSYVIPAGAGARIDRGAALEILPERLEVKVGDVLQIVNHDDRGHLIGPFFVGAHGTARQRFASKGTFRGECSVHPSGRIVITVS